jgi:hypothetical protein
MYAGILCSLILNLDYHSDRYQSIPSGTLSPCYPPEFFGAFDPEKSIKIIIKKNIYTLLLQDQSRTNSLISVSPQQVVRIKIRCPAIDEPFSIGKRLLLGH